MPRELNPEDDLARPMTGPLLQNNRRFFEAQTSRKNGEQVSQVRLRRGIAKIRTDPKDFLQGSKQCSMIVVNGGAVTVAFREGGQNDHPDWAVCSFGFIPGDKHCSAVTVGLRIQDFWQILGEPRVALRDFIAQWAATVVHIIANIGGDEVVPRHRIGRQILGELFKRADVCPAIGGIRVLWIGNIIEVYERIVLHHIRVPVGKRAIFSQNILFVSPPLDSAPGCIFQQGY